MSRRHRRGHVGDEPLLRRLGAAAPFRRRQRHKLGPAALGRDGQRIRAFDEGELGLLAARAQLARRLPRAAVRKVLQADGRLALQRHRGDTRHAHLAHLVDVADLHVGGGERVEAELARVRRLRGEPRALRGGHRLHLPHRPVGRRRVALARRLLLGRGRGGGDASRAEAVELHDEEELPADGDRHHVGDVGPHGKLIRDDVEVDAHRAQDVFPRPAVALERRDALAEEAAVAEERAEERVGIAIPRALEHVAALAVVRREGLVDHRRHAPPHRRDVAEDAERPDDGGDLDEEPREEEGDEPVRDEEHHPQQRVAHQRHGLRDALERKQDDAEDEHCRREGYPRERVDRPRREQRRDGEHEDHRQLDRQVGQHVCVGRVHAVLDLLLHRRELDVEPVHGNHREEGGNPDAEGHQEELWEGLVLCQLARLDPHD
mmetsp:Transcript_21875/g.69519  ORF Transcript_21875/g.69519 Transcript_21875/m.69519 type:complete len:433 (-) Transcript_21875:367-1665(-)